MKMLCDIINRSDLCCFLIKSLYDAVCRVDCKERFDELASISDE